MNKHAYLILAHNEFEVLQKLLEALDDARNDIFIHFDAKVNCVPILTVHHSKLFIIKNRIKVYWADYSMIHAELNLLEEATLEGSYTYFHFLSGVDMPLKSTEQIHSFFEKNTGKEFIDYCLYEVEEEMNRKMKRWHLFPTDFKNSGKLSFITRATRALFIRLQIGIRWQRNKSVIFKKGSQWCSITASFGTYLLKHRPEIEQLFSHTFCPDEVMMQTMCWNSPFKANLYDTSLEYKGHMRLIDWNRGKPYVWQEKDWEELISSDRLFARKFSKSHMGIIDRLLKYIQN